MTKRTHFDRLYDRKGITRKARNAGNKKLAQQENDIYLSAEDETKQLMKKIMTTRHKRKKP